MTEKKEFFYRNDKINKMTIMKLIKQKEKNKVNK